MRIRNLLLASATIGVVTGGLVLAACSDDDNTAPTTPAPTVDAGPGVKPVSDAAPDVFDQPDAATTASNVLYIMSNDPTAGNNNSVYGYHRAADGSLTMITGSPFRTGGAGIGNPGQMLGPEDTDYQLIVNPAHTKLFAVNGGSDTISVFDIHGDGTLTAIAGSPFASGGSSPVALALVGSNLLVTNQDYDLGRSQTGVNAAYVTLAVAPSGALSPATGVTAQPASAWPQLLLPTPDGALAFGAEFKFSAGGASTVGGIRSFALAANGALTKAPGDVFAIPSEDAGTGLPFKTNQFVLGLALNPLNKVLYVGQLGRSEIGAWSYDTSGALTYRGSAPVTGMAPCWIRVSKDGRFGYVTDTALDQISVMALGTDGLSMTETQLFTLAGAGPTLMDAGGNTNHTASEAYDEEISPDGKFLYVESERLSNDPTYKAGNMIHVLAISPTDGKLTEASNVAIDPALGNTTTAPVRSEGLVVF